MINMTTCFVTAGDVHVGMVDRGGQLEVEVNQARGLIAKSGSKNLPGIDFSYCSCHMCIDADITCLHVVCVATYVKVYVLEHGVCLAKKKTKVVKKTLDPTYQQALLFDESPQGKVLQVFTSLLLLVTHSNRHTQQYNIHSLNIIRPSSCDIKSILSPVKDVTQVMCPSVSRL